jgi:ankyrin repeat protein
MIFEPGAFRSPLTAYEQQAEELLAAFRAGDPGAGNFFHRYHPRFRDEKIKWLAKPATESEIRNAAFAPGDARLALARAYDFRDWQALAGYAAAVGGNGPVFAFESAVEAVVNGDLAALDAALSRDPTLVRARSSRVCDFDPPVHRATLLHYIAANGVEHYRQKTPANAVAIARALLAAGAEPDAFADMYGAQWTTMGLLVSSDHPARAGLSVPLVKLLLEFGAAIEGPAGTRDRDRPLFTALAFGQTDAARCLAEQGARIDLPAAAGLGRVDDAARLLGRADAEARHHAISLAAQHGQAEVIRLLLEAGEDPNRFNLVHAHATPLHQAAMLGHDAVVRVLVDRGARLDIRDSIWQGTPLGWAVHGGKAEMAAYLRSLGAPE